MLTEISPGGWVDLDTVCSVLAEDDCVTVGLTNTQAMEIVPKDDDTTVALANHIAALVNRLDEPDPSSQRQALS